MGLGATGNTPQVSYGYRNFDVEGARRVAAEIVDAEP